MGKFYYIALKNGRTCEGIIRSESIDSARTQLTREEMDQIHIAVLRSDPLDFLDLEPGTENGEV